MSSLLNIFAAGKKRWWIFAVSGLVVATAGLWIGKMREGDAIAKLYARTDFTLLDADDDFFRLQDLPAGKMLLLVFTPDGLDPEMAIPFRGFSSHLSDLRKRGVEVMMITRTNREIAKNFRNAAHFQGRLLLDPSGTVGKNIGVWNTLDPTSEWGYALVDRTMRVYWVTTEHVPLSYEQVWTQLKSMK